jgi:Adenovirus endoprotease
MAALHTEQLQYLLAHLVQRVGKVDILGVFPGDCLPSAKLLRARSRDVCFITNTDPLNSPGAHWLAFYYRAPYRTLEYFDSFGFPLNFYKLVAKSVSGPGIKIRCANTNVLQAFDSSACGYYCVLFSRLRAAYCEDVDDTNVAVERIRKLASESSNRDKKVVDLVHKLMHQESCTSLPRQSQFTRQSQTCCSFRLNFKLKNK